MDVGTAETCAVIFEKAVGYLSSSKGGPRQHFEKRTSERINVGTNIDVATIVDLFGRDVISGTHRLASRGHFDAFTVTQLQSRQT